jgi:hypothetical protein
MQLLLIVWYADLHPVVAYEGIDVNKSITSVSIDNPFIDLLIHTLSQFH